VLQSEVNINKKLARSYYRAETLAEVNFKDLDLFDSKSISSLDRYRSFGGIVLSGEMLKSPPPPPSPPPNLKKIIENSVCKRAACETVRLVI